MNLDDDWNKLADLAEFDLGRVVEVVAYSEGDADGGEESEWWMVVRLDAPFGACEYAVLWGDDGATCSQCGAFNSGSAEGEVRFYLTEADARASVPVDVLLEGWPS